MANKEESVNTEEPVATTKDSTENGEGTPRTKSQQSIGSENPTAKEDETPRDTQPEGSSFRVTSKGKTSAQDLVEVSSSSYVVRIVKTKKINTKKDSVGDLARRSLKNPKDLKTLDNEIVKEVVVGIVQNKKNEIAGPPILRGSSSALPNKAMLHNASGSATSVSVKKTLSETDIVSNMVITEREKQQMIKQLETNRKIEIERRKKEDDKRQISDKMRKYSIERRRTSDIRRQMKDIGYQKKNTDALKAQDKERMRIGSIERRRASDTRRAEMDIVEDTEDHRRRISDNERAKNDEKYKKKVAQLQKATTSSTMSNAAKTNSVTQHKPERSNEPTSTELLVKRQADINALHVRNKAYRYGIPTTKSKANHNDAMLKRLENRGSWQPDLVEAQKGKPKKQSKPN